MSRIPYVIEKGEKGEERAYDLFSRLLKDRIIFVNGKFDDDMANSLVAQLLFLEANDKDQDIFMYVNSPGGYISSMYAIYDTMQYVKPDIVTVGYGVVMSAGSFILAAGTKGKRFALPNTDIMIHELSAGTQGKFNDMKIEYKQLELLHAKMARDYVKMTGQKLNKIKKDMERDFYMNPEEALEYGLIDKVEEKRV
jgi:ATP-dependent Clp protease protease subunit